MNKCLYCYKELRPGEVDFHPECARKIFGASAAPELPYSRDNMSELASKVIKTSTSVTGVQAKLSLEIDRGKKNEPSRFTIVGLWGNYILKPQSPQYRCLPELEDVTMKMAETAKIKTARHSLIRFSDGELGYITLRMDRGKKGQKYSMLDMCQLTNRLTEHKYLGSYEQLAQTVIRYSSAPYLDVQKFWELVLFSWITGNSDMHCKNFSLLDEGNGYQLSPAYDLLAVLLADPDDADELAMPIFTGGNKTGFNRESFVKAFITSGIQEVTANKLIDKMIKFWSENLSSRRIHIGMDETQDLGRGKFMNRHGYENPFEIFNRHLGKVNAICLQHGLTPMIWSDMFFSMTNSKHEYYDYTSPFPAEVKRNMDKDVQLVYWDYCYSDCVTTDKFLERHRNELGKKTIFAGGIWTWNRLCPSFAFVLSIWAGCVFQ